MFMVFNCTNNFKSKKVEKKTKFLKREQKWLKIFL